MSAGSAGGPPPPADRYLGLELPAPELEETRVCLSATWSMAPHHSSFNRMTEAIPGHGLLVSRHFPRWLMGKSAASRTPGDPSQQAGSVSRNSPPNRLLVKALDEWSDTKDLINWGQLEITFFFLVCFQLNKTHKHPKCQAGSAL